MNVLIVSLRSVAAAVLALAACSLALGVSQANASHVSCGDVITEDTTLDSDLSCPSTGEPALTIAADGVTLDLGGHMISFFFGLGVLNDGHDGVTIKNGSIGFATGIVIRHADRNRVEDVVAGGVGAGVILEDSDDNRIVRNTLGGDEGGGVGLGNGSDDNVIERNRLGGGLASSLHVSGSDDNLIRRNLILGSESVSLFIRPGSDNTTVSRNEFGGQEGASPSGDGIVVESETTNTLLVRNQVSGYEGIGLPWLGRGEFGDGIHVESASTTLTRNVSNDNARWGIFAVPGVVDGGHNTASGNLFGQCLNVSC